jgi:hypothetical protein
MVILLLTLHPPASVTVTVYTFGHNPKIVSVPCQFGGAGNQL